MTDYTKLVKALRWCANDEICTEEVNCGYWNKEPFCTVSLMTDAAAAIEGLQAEVDALKHDIERYVQMNTELLNDRPELEEIGGKWVWKEPKRGKWIRNQEVKNIYGGEFIECPFCGDKYVVQYLSDEIFCRNCGADMRKMEVQE